MLKLMPPLRPYAFLATGSAGRLMDRVARAIADDAPAQALLSNRQAQIMSDIKTRVKSSGSPAIKSMYWSVRCPDPDVWGGMRARTLVAGPDLMDWLDLPQDPALPMLAAFRSMPGLCQVLRYVPLRRATLLHRPATGPARIVKVKRPDRAADAARRLAAANMALGTAQAFTIPRLLDTHPDGTLVLSLCPGTSLGTGLARNGTGLLRRIGRMHAALHACPPAALPHEQPGDATDSLALTAALRPGLIPALIPLTHLLRDRPAPSDPVLCHGDLGFDQMLLDGDSLSLVDFDLCHAGEAAADIARFLVVLTEAPPPGLTAAVAEAAYLGGYAETRALPAPARLHWFRTEALAARLLICLRKDQSPQIARLLSLINSRVPA